MKDLDCEYTESALGDAKEVLEALKRDQPKNQELLHEEARLKAREGAFYYRRGKEGQDISAWRHAETCLLRVLEIDPSNGQATSDLQAVRARLAGVHEPPLLN